MLGRRGGAARLETAGEAIEGLRHLFTAEEQRDLISIRVATTAVTAILLADAVSITVVTSADAHTAASTDERALELDRQQYRSGKGPCLEAASRRTPVRAVIAAERERWPEFATATAATHARRSTSSRSNLKGATSNCGPSPWNC